MRRFILFVFLTISFIVNAEIQYDIFATCPMKPSTGQPTGQVAQNFMKAILKGSQLSINNNIYNLSNKTIEHDGFQTFEKYDAVDKYNQRCTIIFLTDDSAEWYCKYAICIKYIGQDKAMMFLSNEPIRR